MAAHARSMGPPSRATARCWPARREGLFYWRSLFRHPQSQLRFLQSQAFFSQPQVQFLQSQAPQQADVVAFGLAFVVFNIGLSPFLNCALCAFKRADGRLPETLQSCSVVGSEHGD